MRIISGSKKHYQIRFPSNLHIRPTTDFCREALFNILIHNFNFEESEILDLFSGSGAVSFEFASRGAQNVTAVESNFNCWKFIRNECSKLKFEHIQIVKQDALKFLESVNISYNIIFADPPYEYKNYEKLHETVFQRKLLKPGGWLILEHSKLNNFASANNFVECRKYGETFLSFFYHTQ